MEIAPLPANAQAVLVTGGAGYIGAHACKALHSQGFLPVSLDNLSTGNRARCQWGPLLEGDVTNTETVEAALKQFNPLGVLHFAGQISVPESVRNPAETYATNTLGSLTLLSAMQRHGIKPIVFSSTAAVYGQPLIQPIREDAPLAPLSPYGQSKLCVEKILADFSCAYGTRFAALRYFNAAGATPECGLGYQRPDPFHLIPMVMMATLGQRPALQIFGTDYPTPDGTAVRDYIHVTDIAEAHVLALEHLLRGGENLTLNLGTSQSTSVKEVISATEVLSNRPVPHSVAPRRAGDPSMLVADATRAQRILKWNSKQTLNDILSTEWQWHQTLTSLHPSANLIGGRIKSFLTDK